MSKALTRLLNLVPLAALGVALATSSPAQAKVASDPSIEAPFLWEIQSRTGVPNYLFGTIHAGVDAKELPVIVDAALSQSDLFVMETAPEGFPGNQHYTQKAPMDLSLAWAANSHGSQVAVLETMEFQLDLLKKVGSAEDLAAMLADGSDAIDPLVDAYRAGDLEGISEITKMGDAEFRKLLLTDRNHRWVDKLQRVLWRGGAFIAVGVGHCPGQDGLLDLLDKQGYLIRRLA